MLMWPGAGERPSGGIGRSLSGLIGPSGVTVDEPSNGMEDPVPRRDEDVDDAPGMPGVATSWRGLSGPLGWCSKGMARGGTDSEGPS
jgi:hypothetical protein